MHDVAYRKQSKKELKSKVDHKKIWFPHFFYKHHYWVNKIKTQLYAKEKSCVVGLFICKLKITTIISNIVTCNKHCLFESFVKKF